MDESIA